MCDVEIIGVDREPVATIRSRDRVETVPSQRLPQVRDVDVDGLPRSWRRCNTPDVVDQTLAGDQLVRVQEQDRQQLTLSRAPQRYRPPSRADLERTEDPIIHLG